MAIFLWPFFFALAHAQSAAISFTERQITTPKGAQYRPVVPLLFRVESTYFVNQYGNCPGNFLPGVPPDGLPVENLRDCMRRCSRTRTCRSIAVLRRYLPIVLETGRRTRDNVTKCWLKTIDACPGKFVAQSNKIEATMLVKTQRRSLNAAIFYERLNPGQNSTASCVVDGVPPVIPTSISLELIRETDLEPIWLEPGNVTRVNSTAYAAQVSLVGLIAGASMQKLHCFAANSLGASVDKAIDVEPFALPAFSTFSLSFDNVTSSSARIRWNQWQSDQDIGNGPVVGYKIFVLPIKTEEGFEIDSLPRFSDDHLLNSSFHAVLDGRACGHASHCQFRLRDLNAESSYLIGISPIRPGSGGDNGSISWSGTPLKTHCGTPSAIEFVTSSINWRRGMPQIVVTFEPPAMSANCPNPGEFLVTFFEIGIPASPKKLVVPGAERKVEINDISAGTNYSVAVWYRNSLGKEGTALRIAVWTGVPIEVEIISSNVDSVNLQWGVKPSPAEFPSTFRIAYWPQAENSGGPGGSFMKFQVVNPNESCSRGVSLLKCRAAIRNLQPKRRHFFSVIALRENRSSDEMYRSEAVNASTTCLGSPVPENVGVSKLTRLSITIQWSIAENPVFCDVAKIQLEISQMVVNISNPNTRSYTFGISEMLNLMSLMKPVEIRLRTLNIKGEFGEWSPLNEVVIPTSSSSTTTSTTTSTSTSTTTSTTTTTTTPTTTTPTTTTTTPTTTTTTPTTTPKPTTTTTTSLKPTTTITRPTTTTTTTTTTRPTTTSTTTTSTRPTTTSTTTTSTRPTTTSTTTTSTRPTTTSTTTTTTRPTTTSTTTTTTRPTTSTTTTTLKPNTTSISTSTSTSTSTTTTRPTSTTTSKEPVIFTTTGRVYKTWSQKTTSFQTYFTTTESISLSNVTESEHSQRPSDKVIVSVVVASGCVATIFAVLCIMCFKKKKCFSRNKVNRFNNSPTNDETSDHVTALNNSEYYLTKTGVFHSQTNGSAFLAESLAMKDASRCLPEVPANPFCTPSQSSQPSSVVNGSQGTPNLSGTKSSPLSHGSNTWPNPSLESAGSAIQNAAYTCSAIRVDRLKEAIGERRSDENALYRKEFASLSRKVDKPQEIGRSKGNANRNRYKDVFPYDFNCVLLDDETNVKEPIYVNASYVKGANGEREYVASQGPSCATVAEFWKMIWQLNINCVVMLTNTHEKGKVKCFKYWPDLQEMTVFEGITVETTNVKEFSFYIRRTLRVRLRKLSGQTETCVRTVTQFQFTNWPDNKAVRFATPVLSFLRKVNKYRGTSKTRFPAESDTGTRRRSPGGSLMLVHCSAGIGRTGTFLAADIITRQAEQQLIRYSAHDVEVDIRKVVNNLRDQRHKMVQNIEQYMLVYDLVYEALACDPVKPTATPLSLIGPVLVEKLHREFEVLERLKPTIARSEYSIAMDVKNAGKNRVQRILPPQFCRVQLLSLSDDKQDYISAIWLDGIQKAKCLIASQSAMPHTISDFWSVVWDWNVGAIVSLDPKPCLDPTYCPIGPSDESGTVHHGNYKIKSLRRTASMGNDESSRPYVVDVLSLTNGLKKTENSREVRHFSYTGAWLASLKGVPASVEQFAEFVIGIDEARRATNGKPVLVHCLDGATRTGLTVLAILLKEQCDCDDEVDVFTVAKSIRNYRPEFIVSQDQYSFANNFLSHSISSES